MPIRFLLFMSFMWFSLHLLFGIITADTSGAFSSTIEENGETKSNPIQNVAFMNLINMREISAPGGFVSFEIPAPSTQFFPNLYRLFAWNYPFFTDGWIFIRLFFLMPLSFAATLLFTHTLSPIYIAIGSLIINALIATFASVSRFIPRFG